MWAKCSDNALTTLLHIHYSITIRPFCSRLAENCPIRAILSTLDPTSCQRSRGSASLYHLMPHCSCDLCLYFCIQPWQFRCPLVWVLRDERLNAPCYVQHTCLHIITQVYCTLLINVIPCHAILHQQNLILGKNHVSSRTHPRLTTCLANASSHISSHQSHSTS